MNRCQTVLDNGFVWNISVAEAVCSCHRRDGFGRDISTLVLMCIENSMFLYRCLVETLSMIWRQYDCIGKVSDGWYE